MKILALISFFISLNVIAIVPDSDFQFPSIRNKDNLNPLTEKDLKEVTDRLQKIYGDVVTKSYNSKLIFDTEWDDNTVNAFASRPTEGEFHIHVPGGIVRAKGMSKDSLALVLCHELGHHLGGAPRTNLFNGWPAAEGQADYWATSKCLKKYFFELKNEDVDVASNVPDRIMKDCNKIYSDFPSMKICVRSILAAIDFSVFLNQLPSTKVPVKMETPDSKVVKGTNINDYPRPQCRFDTLYQGALCNISFNDLTSNTDPSVASCMDQNQLGARPKCWFANK